MPPRTKTVQAGSWRTLESFWNVTTTAFFRLPPGAEIKIRYSGWLFAADRQKQRLDGTAVRRLAVSRWSVFVARVQIKVLANTTVTYYVEPGSVANLPPEIHF